jgi:hypothetical protein
VEKNTNIAAANDRHIGFGIWDVGFELPQFDTLLTSSFNWAAVKQNNKWGLSKLP